MESRSLHRWFKRQKYFAGFGTTPIEALALNTPVVSSLFVNFPSRKREEIKKLGLIPVKAEDISKCILYILNNPDKYQDTRMVVEKYYSWEKTIKINIEVFDNLLNDYYGRDMENIA